jgi:DNA-binding response OmpR family regulator
MNKPLALIVEDDPQLSRIFSLSLQDEFEIEIIPDGEAALARLALVIPAILLLDLHLPGVSGKKVFKSVQADERLENTRIIVCTADASEAEVLREEADIVLLKPVSPVQLRVLASRLRPNAS